MKLGVPRYKGQASSDRIRIGWKIGGDRQVHGSTAQLKRHKLYDVCMSALPEMVFSSMTMKHEINEG